MCRGLNNITNVVQRFPPTVTKAFAAGESISVAESKSAANENLRRENKKSLLKALASFEKIARKKL